MKRKRPRTIAHVFITVLLFALATVGITLQTVNSVSGADIALQFSSDTSNLNASTTGVLVVLIMSKSATVFSPRNIFSKSYSSVVADTLLRFKIWRCYLVWAARIKFVVLPAGLCVLNNVAALVIALVDPRHAIEISSSSEHPQPNVTPPTLFPVFLYGALISNIVLTSMIAGRIYYVIRNDLTLLGPQVQRTYKTAVAVSIESGILYPIALAVEAAIIPAIHHVDPNENVKHIRYHILGIVGRTMYLLLIQIVGIAPTLIVIRIGLGYCVVDENVEDRNRRLIAGQMRVLREPDSEVLDISSDAISG
ncbi:hypothetical protein VNI00_000771 [Paramarasmius palmivorus]|uniref:Uncharacterized protein n=1 Tax=Paramarasmius palmivorus TaxID=297713 RepID=A0AAW0E681_9AGAR